MAAKKRKIINYRQLKVAEIWGRDREQNQETIAAILLSEFGIKASQPTISRDIKLLDQRNLDKSDAIIKAAKAQVLAEYEFVYAEAISAWHKSCLDNKSNAALLGQAQTALNNIEKLYGLASPQKLDASIQVDGKLVILPAQDD